MEIQAIFVNLPVSDVAASRAFWTALGLEVNEMFSSDQALSLVLKEGSVYAMLLDREYFATFTGRPLSDGSTTQVLNALQLGSREEVIAFVSRAIDQGASRYQEAKDHGWTYYDSFADPDGHQWEISWMSPEAYPQEAS